MNQWSQPEVRLVRVEIHASAARGAVGAPGGELVIEPGPHVAAFYQVLIGGRVVLEDAVTLHGPTLAGPALLTGGALPGDVRPAVEALWSHAKEKIAEHAGLPPPGSPGPAGA